ncbi:MAG: DUF5696 domain-containing protein [Treponema sp.]|nr:DUF5696 domain-containing protein [Treponema sp.]MCL2272071.1 DUF5696 domain-containing protein [Treponema sp.]
MKKVVWLLITIVLLALTACGGRPYASKNVTIYEYDGSTEEVVLENEYLSLIFLPETTEIILVNKANGSQWRSLPGGEDNLADPVTKNMMDSIFFLEYANVYGIGQTLYSSEQSVKLGAYEYGIKDGALEVNYSVGNLERTYVIPPAVPEERMKEFIDKMSAGEKSLVNAGYRLYNINSLRRDDDRDSLLAMYPDLNRRNIYVLSPIAQEYQKAEYEKYFAAVGYTYDDYLEDVAYYPTLASAERPAFNITFRYSLEGKSLVLNIPFDKIAYRSNNPITTLSVMPYMGAGGLEDEGYLLVPDGSGALIYFNNGRQNQTSYNSIVYGWDEGLVRKAVVSDNRSPFPAFGIQKNGNALLCIMENGASYSNVRADVSGRNSSWNNVYARFSMVKSELMNISGKSQRDVYQYERSLPEGEGITLRYVVCENDGYVGMANEYRKWFVNKFPAMNRRAQSGLQIAVEIPGAVNKTQHRLGIPFDLPLKLTSYSEAADMVNNFSALGWKNVNIKLNGWFNRSVDHSIPTRIKLIRTLGSRKNFNDLVNAANSNGFELYPEVDFFFMKDKKAFDGFSLYNDASRYISRERIQRYPYSFVWFGERARWGKLSYVARPDTMMSLIDSFTDKSDNFGFNNVAFRNIGSRLAGDYNERKYISRETSMKMRQEKLEQLRNSGTGIMLLSGHAYAAPWADFIVDLPLDCQGFGITDVSVPFYPMVLHGLVPYAGKAINLAEDYTYHLLKTIESGAGVYFSFMTEETEILQETKFRQFYANVYSKWIGDADRLVRQLSADLGHLYNQTIVNHEIVSNGVTVTEYEDGTRIAVNTNNFTVEYGGRFINANNYTVLGRGN